MSHATGARLTLGPLENPVRGLLHGSAALLSLALAAHLSHLLEGAGGERLLLLAFPLSQAALFSASALYHSVPWRGSWKQRMQRVDHSLIYVCIAGTLSPIAYLGLDGPACGLVLAAAWAIALLGSLQKLLLPRVNERASIAAQLLQACLVLPAAAPFALRFPAEAVLLFGAGGALYLVGAAVFVLERPRLWPRVFSFHELFHLLVVAGSAAHYVLTFRHLVRAL